MSSSNDEDSSVSTVESERESGWRGLPRWQKILLVLSVVSILVGGALYAVGQTSGGAPETEGARSHLPEGAGSFLEGGVGGESGGEPGAAGPEGGSATDWAPLFLKGGFSFLIGFAIGYALRSFLKIAAIIVGLVALALFGLSYAGVVQVDWSAIEGHFERLWEQVRGEAGAFKTFVTGSLPSAATAALGLFTGLKRG